MKTLSVLLATVISASHPLVAEPEDSQAAADVSVPNKEAAAMTGSYVGAFGKRKIHIRIDRVIGSTVSGYSIVAGNERAFSGSFEAKDGGFRIVAKEPGDHPDDGIFTMSYQPKTQILEGEWAPNRKEIGKKTFKLPSRKFSYNPKAGKYPQSSARRLAEKDVENLKPEELRVMRNEIYARHGYCFKMADMREHFDALDWYMPVAVDIQNSLTETEKKNAELIKRYEKYGEEYYDSFGR